MTAVGDQIITIEETKTPNKETTMQVTLDEDSSLVNAILSTVDVEHIHIEFEHSFQLRLLMEVARTLAESMRQCCDDTEAK